MIVDSKCNVVPLHYFSLNDATLLCCCLDVFEHAKLTKWHHCNAHNVELL